MEYIGNRAKSQYRGIVHKCVRVLVCIEFLSQINVLGINIDILHICYFTVLFSYSIFPFFPTKGASSISATLVASVLATGT